jgi:phage terminase large subunit-like protein
MRNYPVIATKYAQDVVNGKIPVCKWVRLACSKFLADLEKESEPEYPYCFNKAKATRVCRFIEAMPHVVDDFKNRAAKSEKIVLLPWQVFIFVNLFGFVSKATGLRRFREAYITIPKKNGKSTIMAGLALYMLIADGEMSANVKLGATGIKHVSETLFQPAKNMIQRSPALKAKVGVQVNANSIVVPGTGSKLECVIGDPGDGPSISCGIMDESHELTTAALYDKFKTGTIARSQPLVISITTAGFDLLQHSTASSASA